MRLNLLLLCLSLIASGCNFGNHYQNQSEGNNEITETAVANIATMAEIPYANNPDNYALLTVINPRATSLSFKDIIITNGAKELKKAEQDKYFDLADCKQIKSNSSCKIKIHNNLPIGGYLLNLYYTTSNNKVISLNQMINVTGELVEQDGFILNRDNNTNKETNFNLPVLLDKDFNQVSAIYNDTNLPVNCSNGYHKGSLCTLSINKSSYTANAEILLRGQQTGFTDSFASAVLSVNPNLSANLIVSTINPVISPANGSNPYTVTLYNNGAAPATGVNINALTPLKIENNFCTSTLAANSSCTFKINTLANLSASGNSSVMINYLNQAGNQILSLNVSYIIPVAGASLEITSSGSFLNTLTNTSSYVTAAITNNGTTPLTNLKFNNLYTINSAMSSFVTGSNCQDGQTLLAGASCMMKMSYAPSSTTSPSTAPFIVTASYTGSGGETLTYSNTSLTLPFSAVSSGGGKFKTVGDFGMVFTSPNGGAGTWIANVASPFATTTTSANSMLVNGNTHVMTLSDGSIDYSTLNGLFWQASPLGSGKGIDFSSCSIVYDGSNYYTCGTPTQNFQSCTNSRGCVIKTSNLASGWNGMFSTSQTANINDISYFNNGSNSAFVATVANSNSGLGLITSADGATWNQPNSGIGGAANSNFFSVVLGASNTLYAWNSVGYRSSEPIATVTTNWTGYTTTRPAASAVRGALYEGGIYILAMSDGDIYTSTNVTSFTRGYNGSTQFNKLIYASGINSGTYLAVGNSGVNVSTTTPTGTWTANTGSNLANGLVVGQNTTTMNLTGASYDAAKNNIWLTGVNAIFKSNGSVTSWKTPALQSIAKNGSSYLAVDNLGNMYSSNNASNWSQVDLSGVSGLTTGTVLNTVYCPSNNLCFAVGENGTILKTTDGTSWTKLDSGTTRNLMAMVCQDNNCVIAGGNNATNTGTLLYSNDYTGWVVTTATLPTSKFNGITYYNNKYFAVGNGGVIYASTNGLNWSSVTSSTTNDLNAIACGENIGCVAVGDSGRIIFSAFGTSWTSTSNGTSDITSVSYNAGVFAAVGKAGRLIYSSNMSSWTAATWPTNNSNSNNLYAVIPD
ncbi:hypothetical protein [Aquella oligotrophica]|uniref:DUF11 domain-containing protein n=1 Tax=Aquella oligotrophica TaxID=2067065 RepID=A0A2I7N8N3_9NEIS|nr:hypothetical protein [Aquella oligotrophica]AUR52801.1 hypothetical protein CUN60_11020 [Aquella oligotrophica]